MYLPKVSFNSSVEWHGTLSKYLHEFCYKYLGYCTHFISIIMRLKLLLSNKHNSFCCLRYFFRLVSYV